MPIMEEKREQRDSNKERHQKRNTHLEMEPVRKGSINTKDDDTHS